MSAGSGFLVIGFFRTWIFLGFRCVSVWVFQDVGCSMILCVSGWGGSGFRCFNVFQGVGLFRFRIFGVEDFGVGVLSFSSGGWRCLIFCLFGFPFLGFGVQGLS